MNKLDYRTLHEALRTQGRYETPAEHRPTHPVKTSFFHTLEGARVVALDVIGMCAWLTLRKRFDYLDWARLCTRSINFAERLGATVTLENFLPRAQHAGPVVYVSNHMSTFETIVLPASLTAFGELSIILKKSLTEIPYVGDTARALGCIPVTRKNVKEDLMTVLEVGTQRLKDGKSVLLFPQGTRQAVFESKRFNSLGAKLAERAGVPLVPLAVQTDFMKTGKVVKDFGPIDPTRPVRFCCGPLFSPELGAKKAHEQSVAWMAEKLREWGLPVA